MTPPAPVKTTERTKLKSRRRTCVLKLVAMGALLVALLVVEAIWLGSSDASMPVRACFSKEAWSGNDRYRPCVEIVRVEENGVFKAAVSDASGTVRYSAGFGSRSQVKPDRAATRQVPGELSPAGHPSAERPECDC
jgi:hypothetical protein